METMHFREKKKSSKGAVIGLFLFFAIGAVIIYLAVSSEKTPVVIGSQESEINRLVNTEAIDKQEIIDKNASINYEVKDKAYNDKSNVKIKSNMKLPVLSIEGEDLSDINSKIDTEYTELFDKFKTQLASADSKYTYTVSYSIYDNTIGTSRILSITIYQRMTDDSAKKNTMNKIQTYNIDLSKKETVSLATIAQELLGKDYKTKIKAQVCDYLVEQGMLKEEEYTYALTGLEEYYVKEGEFHIVFNESGIVDTKYGVLDIVIK